MIILRLLVIVLTAIFLSGHVTASPDTVSSPDTPTITRFELLAKDTAYQQFVLDSMDQADRAKIRQIEAQSGNSTDVRPEAIIGVFIPIVSILAVFLFLWRSNESKKAVRLAMIERGMDPSLLNDQPSESSRKYGALRIGMLLTGVGLGLLIGFLISEAMHLPEDTIPLVIIANALIFGGGGLIAYHKMASKLERDGSK